MDLRARSDGNLVVVVLMMLGLIGVCVNGEIDEVVAGAPMVKTEQEALYSAIEGFVGKWWNGSDLYPDPCGWTPIQGVSCDIFDGFWYVTDLNIGPIHENSLPCTPNIELKPDLFKLKHLKSLSFYNCINGPVSIQSADWAALSTTLVSIEFRSNPGLTGQIPTALGQLKQLESLVLVQNGLSGGLPHNIGNLTHLKRLVLSGNLFTGKIPDNYGYLDELLIMDLSINLLSGTLPFTFGGLTSLLKFDLSKNQLEGQIPLQISNLKNLTLLDLSNNKFSGDFMLSVQEMGSLKELILSNNLISGDLMKFNWENVRGLVVLDLSNMRLSGGIPETITKMKKLRFLGLSGNNLSGSLSSKFGELGELNAFYVNGNNLTGMLGFSREFYLKMGRRFGAWNNTNLCFPVGLMSESVRPFGVKGCRTEL